MNPGDDAGTGRNPAGAFDEKLQGPKLGGGQPQRLPVDGRLMPPRVEADRAGGYRPGGSSPPTAPSAAVTSGSPRRSNARARATSTRGLNGLVM